MMKQSEKMRKSFNTLISLSLLATILVLAASCKKEDFNDDPDVIGVERNINTSAGLPKTNDKAYLNGYKVEWNQGDIININGTFLTAAAIDNSADNPRATFYGTVYALKEATTNNDVYWAAYPAYIAETYNGGIPADFTTSALTFTLPDTQIYNANNRTLQDYTCMAGRSSVAEGANPTFQMLNLGAVMKVHLEAASGVAQTHVSKLVFTSTSNNLSGEFSIDASESVSQGTTGAGKLTVCLKEGNNDYIDISGNGADVYVFLPPIAQGGNLTMKIYNTDGYMTKMVKSSLPTAIDRNRIYTNSVSDITFNEYDIYYSVSASSKVLFSPGNLQWSATNGTTIPSTHVTATGTAAGTWRFAENQWNFVGGVNVGASSRDQTTDYGNVYANGVKCNNNLIDQNYTGWIDMFGWGTSGWDNRSEDANSIYFQPWDTTKISATNPVDETYNYFGYGPSTNNSNPNLSGSYYDWGLFNAIYNPATQHIDAPGTWRTITYAEWRYMIFSRANASQKYGHANIDGINGFIVLPDLWIMPAGLSFIPTTSSSSSSDLFLTNTYTKAQWSLMEKAGATFLPAAGYRSINKMQRISDFGDYHSGSYFATPTANLPNISRECYIPYFTFESLNQQYSNEDGVGERWYGRSVRLVKDYVE